MERTKADAKKFSCSHCGHSHDKPFPELPKEETAQKASKFDEITCYATRLNILLAWKVGEEEAVEKMRFDRQYIFKMPKEKSLGSGFPKKETSVIQTTNRRASTSRTRASKC